MPVYRHQEEYFLGAAPAAPATDWAKYAGPALSGLMMALIGYGTARTFDVDRAKAWGIAATLGFSTAIGQIAAGWLRAQTEDALATAKAVAPVTATVVPSTPAVPAAVPQSAAPAGLLGW